MWVLRVTNPRFFSLSTMPWRGDLFCVFARGEEDAQIAEIIPCGSGDNRVAERGKERAGIEAGEVCFGVEVIFTRAGNGRGVRNGACYRAVSVDAVRTGTEEDQRLAFVFRKVEGGSECQLLVASATAGLRAKLDGDFATGKKT